MVNGSQVGMGVSVGIAVAVGVGAVGGVVLGTAVATTAISVGKLAVCSTWVQAVRRMKDTAVKNPNSHL
jgi:hypothetical protein